MALRIVAERESLFGLSIVYSLAGHEDEVSCATVAQASQGPLAARLTAMLAFARDPEGRDFARAEVIELLLAHVVVERASLAHLRDAGGDACHERFHLGERRGRDGREPTEHVVHSVEPQAVEVQLEREVSRESRACSCARARARAPVQRYLRAREHRSVENHNLVR